MYMILFSFLNARWRSISSSALLSFFFPSFFLPLPTDDDDGFEAAAAARAAVGCCAVRQLSGGDAGYIMVLGHLLLHFFLVYFHFDVGFVSNLTD
jgi:hypothetical protein